MTRILLLLALAACGGAQAAPDSPQPASAPAPAPAPASASAPAPAPAPAPRPTTGSLLFGDIAAPKNFDPKPALDAATPALLSCYADARVAHPDLRGKLRLQVIVNEVGNVVGVSADPGDKAYDADMLACMSKALRAQKFPKPGGTATLLAPLVLRP
jgi:hypothetical protein